MEPTSLDLGDVTNSNFIKSLVAEKLYVTDILSVNRLEHTFELKGVHRDGSVERYFLSVEVESLRHRGEEIYRYYAERFRTVETLTVREFLGLVLKVATPTNIVIRRVSRATRNSLSLVDTVVSFLESQKSIL